MRHHITVFRSRSPSFFPFHRPSLDPSFCLSIRSILGACSSYRWSNPRSVLINGQIKDIGLVHLRLIGLNSCLSTPFFSIAGILVKRRDGGGWVTHPAPFPPSPPPPTLVRRHSIPHPLPSPNSLRRFHSQYRWSTCHGWVHETWESYN